MGLSPEAANDLRQHLKESGFCGPIVPAPCPAEDARALVSAVAAAARGAGARRVCYRTEDVEIELEFAGAGAERLDGAIADHLARHAPAAAPQASGGTDAPAPSTDDAIREALREDPEECPGCKCPAYAHDDHGQCQRCGAALEVCLADVAAAPDPAAG